MNLDIEYFFDSNKSQETLETILPYNFQAKATKEIVYHLLKFYERSRRHGHTFQETLEEFQKLLFRMNIVLQNDGIWRLEREMIVMRPVTCIINSHFLIEFIFEVGRMVAAVNLKLH